MIVVGRSLLAEISRHAEAAYPSECCGLLAGRDEASSETTGEILITRVVTSDNVSQSSTLNSFEVDPQVRFELMQALDGTDERIVGHYHSHPDHPAEPSATDLSMVYEPELYWLIASVSPNKNTQITTTEIKAFRASPDAATFAPVPLRVVEE